jgi:hypothetical protein
VDEAVKVYLLWFNEWEANYVLGIFETYQEAERWKNYFIANPIGDGYVAPSMKHFAEREKRHGDDWTTRFEIEECFIGQLNKHINVDNLKLLELEAKKDEKVNP